MHQLDGDGVLVIGVGERDAHPERDAEHHAVREGWRLHAVPAAAHEVELAVHHLGAVGHQEIVDLGLAGQRGLGGLEDAVELVGRARALGSTLAAAGKGIRHRRGSSSPSEKGG